MKRAVPAAGLAALCGLAVFAYTSTIDSVYQAKASAVVRPIVSNDDLTTVMRLENRWFESKDLPLLPTLPRGERGLQQVLSRAAARLDMSPAELREAVELRDTALEPLFSSFQERPRRVKAIARSPEPEGAARIANVTLDEYLAYRRRWYERALEAVERYLRGEIRRARQGPPLLPSGPGRAAEDLDTVILFGRLEAGSHGPPRSAPAPADAVSPRRSRDVVVAALIGGLLGWLLPAYGPRALRWRPGGLRPGGSGTARRAGA